MTKDTEDLEIKSQWGQEAKSDTSKSPTCRVSSLCPQKTYHLTSPQTHGKAFAPLEVRSSQNDPASIWVQGPHSSGCSRTLPTRVLPVFLQLLWTPCPGMLHLLPESLLPQGNILPPTLSIEKCSSNYLFQSSACWGTRTDTFPMGKNVATAKAGVSRWNGFRIIVWRSTAPLFVKRK